MLLSLTGAGIDYTPAPDQQYLRAETKLLLTDTKHKPQQTNWDSYWATQQAQHNPTYLHRSQIFRYNGRYIIANADAEATFSAALRTKLFQQYFAGLDAVAEFGCGSGNNLAQLHKLYPQIACYGYDWAPAAVKLVQQQCTAEVFDMCRPNPSVVQIKEPCFGVLTHGAMEQLGTDFMAFFDFLRGLTATVYVHVEPLIELYDNTEFDQLAVDYHMKRGYLGKFLTELRKYYDPIVCRTGFGNRLNEGYMIAVWTKPNPLGRISI